MSARAELGLGDVWGSPSDNVDRCECGREFDFDCEPCRHDNCPECRDSSECCLECQTCHKFSDGYEFEDDVCIDCQVAAMERAEARAESDLALLEDRGREQYYAAKYGGEA